MVFWGDFLRIFFSEALSADSSRIASEQLQGRKEGIRKPLRIARKS